MSASIEKSKHREALLDGFLAEVSRTVAGVLCYFMAELRKQAKTQSSKQAKKILDGELNALDLVNCWNACLNSPDDPWPAINSHLTEKFVPLFDDEHRVAIDSISIAEAQAVALLVVGNREAKNDSFNH